jgi:hypothetical protein
MMCVRDARIAESIIPNMLYYGYQHPFYNKHYILSTIISAGNGMTYIPFTFLCLYFIYILITSSFITSFNYVSAVVL